MAYLQTPEATDRKPTSVRKLRPKQVLNGARLPAHVHERDLWLTSLQGVDAHDVIFEDLRGGKTLFDNANLSGSRFVSCDFPNSAFTCANLQDVYASHTSFTGSNFLHAQLSGARLTDQVILDTAIFDHAIMHGVSIAHAVMASFDHINGEGMSFLDADLRFSSFVGANIAGADFTNAIVRGVDFTNADLTEVEITAAQLVTTEGWERARGIDGWLRAGAEHIVELRAREQERGSGR